MADQTDVEEAIVLFLTQALYPAGIPAANDVALTVGIPVTVSRGWPDPQVLDGVLADKRGLVTVWPDHGRDVTRFVREWQTAPIAGLVALKVCVLGGVKALFTGTVTPGQSVGIQVQFGGTTKQFTYQTKQGDALVNVTSALATAIGNGASYSNAVLIAPGPILAISVTDAAGQLPLKQQDVTYRLVCWTPDPLSRDRLASAVDLSMAQVRMFVLLDGSVTGVPIQAGGYTIDQGGVDRSYRRDLMWHMEHTTVLVQQQPTLIFVNTTLNSTVDPIAPAATAHQATGVIVTVDGRVIVTAP